MTTPYDSSESSRGTSGQTSSDPPASDPSSDAGDDAAARSHEEREMSATPRAAKPAPPSEDSGATEAPDDPRY